MKKLKNLFNETKVLLKSMSALTLMFFILAVVLMNLLANVVFIDVPGILVLDGGIFLSWIVFLALDMVCKRYGPKAANIITVVAVLVNLAMTGVFALTGYIGSLISTNNEGLLLALKGDYFILLSSTLAMIVSAVFQNFVNYGIKRIFKKKNSDKKFTSYAVASYVSTALGQFIDNLVFGIFLYLIYFNTIQAWGDYTFVQVLGQAVIAMFIELLCEVIFSPIGYKVAKKWEAEGRGQDYIDLCIQNRDRLQ